MWKLLFVTAIVIAAAGGAHRPASAAETQVGCFDPSSQVSTGLDGTEPRFTISCYTASTGKIVYFAYRISANPAVAQMLQTQFDVFVQMERASGLSANNIDLIPYTDLSNESGNSWGCGAANCRIIDYLTFLVP